MVRHAKSPANGAEGFSLGMGIKTKDVGLDEIGLKECADLRIRFMERGVVDFGKITVSASEYRRAIQTPEEVGFTQVVINPLLNESAEAMPMKMIREKLRQGWLPKDSLKQAELFLDDPSKHFDYNFSHGLTIASIRWVSGERAGDTRELVPKRTEIVEVTY